LASLPGRDSRSGPESGRTRPAGRTAAQRQARGGLRRGGPKDGAVPCTDRRRLQGNFESPSICTGQHAGAQGGEFATALNL
jgi:hypothetical protein